MTRQLHDLPSLTVQGFTARLVPKVVLAHSVNDRHYNGSICAFAGTRWLAYRMHIADQGRCQLTICEVNQDGMPIGPHQLLELPGRKNQEHHEDPRLFVHAGNLWLAFTAASNYDDRFKCQMRLVQLGRRADGPWRVIDELPLHFGQNDLGREKNWQFFSSEGQLYFVYTLSPHVVVAIDDTTGDVLDQWETDGIGGWEHGTLSGSTPPLPMGGAFFSIFHSATLHPARVRRYSASAYRFELKPPFNIIECTDPFIYGSAHDGFLTDPRAEKLKYEPIVIFPCGSTWRDDNPGVLCVSCGYNDHGLAMFDLDPAKLDWRSPNRPRAMRYFKTDRASLAIRGGKSTYLPFVKTRIVDDQWEGVTMTSDVDALALARERWDVQEITRQEFAQALLEAQDEEQALAALTVSSGQP